MDRRIVALNDRRRRIGESHPNSKLEDEDIDLIFALREEGLSLSAIAAKFEVGKSCVHKILHGHRRAHTPVEWVPAGARKPGAQGSRTPQAKQPAADAPGALLQQTINTHWR